MSCSHTVFMKFVAVYGNVLGFHIHSLLSHSEQLPILEAPFMVIVYNYTVFYLLYHIFIVLIFTLVPFFYCILGFGVHVQNMQDSCIGTHMAVCFAAFLPFTHIWHFSPGYPSPAPHPTVPPLFPPIDPSV